MPPVQSSVTQSLKTAGLGERLLRQDAERRVRLFVTGAQGTSQVTLYAGLPVTIGRGTSVDLAIADTSLSREHARFELLDGEVWVTDLGSTNGTRVLGKRETQCLLVHGAEAVLGRVSVVVHIDPPRAPELADIVPAGHFQRLLSSELTRSSLFGHPLALVRVEAAARSEPPEAWYASLAKLLRPVDQTGFWRSAGVQIYLPETDASGARQRLEGFAITAGAGFRVGIAAFPEHARDLAGLTEAATTAQRRASDASPLSVSDPIPATPAAPIALSQAMRQLLDKVAKLGPRNAPVLIQGEGGSGKEHVGRLLHAESGRRHGPCEVLNLRAIPEALVESALFGREREAAGGGEPDIVGIFEKARGGTVLLEHVSELGAPQQAALLHVLEARSFSRVGSTKAIATDVRVIATSEDPLETLCAEGRFRRDLLLRLNAFTLEVPPLRARRDDILALAATLADACAERERLAKKPLTEEAQALLLAYEWPGNVRELVNEIERAIVLSDGPLLAPRDFSERLHAEAARLRGEATPIATAESPASAEPLATPETEPPQALASLDFLECRDLKAEVHRYEAELIRATLARCGGNQTEAAKLLRLPRRTLVYKLRVLGIAPTD